MSSTSPPSSTSTHPSETLSFTSLNPTQPTTILLIHGLQSTGQHGWDLITPHLSTYHLLIPDLPGHGSSAHISPYTIPHATTLLAALIRSHAHQGVAHVVGLSLGGYVGRRLARVHPELVSSLFGSGCSGTAVGWKKFVTERPRLLAALNAPLGVVPQPVVRVALTWGLGIKAQAVGGMIEDAARHGSAELLGGWFGSIAEEGGDRALPGVRVLLVAGGKQDDVPATKRLGLCLRDGGEKGCRAFVVREAIHAWSLQMDGVFADGVKAWIEGKDMPVEFEDLLV